MGENRNYLNLQRFGLAWLLLTVTASCVLSSKAPTFQHYVFAPKPAIPRSHIEMEVNVNLASFENLALKALPGVMHNTAWPKSDEVTCLNPATAGAGAHCYIKYELGPRNSTFSWHSPGSVTINTKIPYKIWLEGNQKITCGVDDERAVNVVTTSSLTVSSDIYLSVDSRSQLITLDAPNPCTRTDIASDAVRAAFVKAISKIDQSVSSYFDGFGQNMWDKIQREVVLAKYNHFGLEGLKLTEGPVSVSTSTAVVKLGLDALAHCEFGPLGNHQSGIPDIEKVPFSNPDFHTYWNIRSDYAFITEVLRQEFAGRIFETKDADGRVSGDLRIKDFEVSWENENKIRVTVKADGKIRKRKYKEITFYILGTPALDNHTYDLTMPDADYFVAAESDPIRKAGLDLTQLPMAGKVQTLGFNVRKKIDDGIKELNAIINKDVTDSLTFSGNINGFSRVTPFMLPAEILFVTQVSGTLKITVK